MVRGSRTFIISALSLICTFCFSAETTAPLFEHSSSESIVVMPDPESGGAQTRHISINYHKLYLAKPYDRELIARERIVQEQADATDGGIATATVDLFYRQKDQSYSSTADHTTTVSEASELKFNPDHWLALTLGCCDAEPFLQLFAYGESQPFLYTNSKYVQAILPNAGVTRYAGMVLRAQTPLDEQQKAIFGNNHKAIAAILYAAPGKPLQKLLLQPKPGVSEDDVPYHTLELDLKSKSAKDEDSYNDDRNISKVLTMWSQDALPGQPVPASLSGLTIIATFSGNDGKPEKVSIPIENDKFGTPKVASHSLQVLEEK